MYRTIITSAAVAVAALAIVATASAVTGPEGCARAVPNPYFQGPTCSSAKGQPQRSHKPAVTKPAACARAIPNPYYQAPACSAPDRTRRLAAVKVTPPVGCKYAMPTSRAQALACSSRNVNAPLSPAVLSGIQRAGAAKGLPLSPDVRQEIYDANHRETQSLPQTASDGLDPAIATAIAATSAPLLEGGVDSVSQQIRDAQAAHAAAPSSVSSDPGFNWGSAGIGAVAGAVLLIAAVGSGALVRRRRQPLHA